MRPKGSQDGTIAVMAAAVLIIMIAMFGFALDLSRTYNRKVELQNAADAVALAAANELDGTASSIDKAVQAAANRAPTFGISYNNGYLAWKPEALTFSTAPANATWVAADVAKANPQKVFFARVDTSMLDPGNGRIQNVLIPILSSALAETNVSAAAVAGRDSTNALPLAVCANDNAPVKTPAPLGELVEYGFRRGVVYDLMNLPGSPPARSFLISPIAPAGTVGDSMMGRLDIVAAYVCTGKMAIPSLRGGAITAEVAFPIASLFQQLNSRFGPYVTPCQSSSMPVDPNGTSFKVSTAAWLKTKGGADQPLWSYAKAAKYTSYVSNGGVEPATGYATFSTTDWSTGANLYPGWSTQNYPATTPYQNTSGGTAYKTLYNTRVLHVPLLQCPVPAGAKVAATVLGLGKFFMTEPATSSTLVAEFAGVEPWTASSGNARLYQ
jgi:Flp pilus assembly protein TadG